MFEPPIDPLAPAGSRRGQRASRALSFLSLAVVACASTASTGTRPSEMSVAEHERAAREDETLAEAQEHQYDEDAWQTSGSCSDLCFSTWSNPTAEHAELARRYRAEAAEHRAASKVLQNAEQAACQGIPERDRDVSPFFHEDDIVGWEKEPRSGPEGPVAFRIHFRAIEGVDVERMQHLLDCHLARSAARGYEAPEMPYCPLVLEGVSAVAKSAPTGLDVVLTVEAASQYDVERRLERVVSKDKAEGAP